VPAGSQFSTHQPTSHQHIVPLSGPLPGSMIHWQPGVSAGEGAERETSAHRARPSRTFASAGTPRTQTQNKNTPRAAKFLLQAVPLQLPDRGFLLRSHVHTAAAF
jgi:hypothetical protein